MRGSSQDRDSYAILQPEPLSCHSQESVARMDASRTQVMPLLVERGKIRGKFRKISRANSPRVHHSPRVICASLLPSFGKAVCSLRISPQKFNDRSQNRFADHEKRKRTRTPLRKSQSSSCKTISYFYGRKTRCRRQDSRFREFARLPFRVNILGIKSLVFQRRFMSLSLSRARAFIPR